MEYIFLSGEVGFEITPNLVNEKFNELKRKEVTIYVSSVGGFAFDGIAIYDFLKLKQAQGYKIHTVGSGVTASAGTFIFLAGNKKTRKIHNTTTFLIHEGWNIGGGNADDFEKQAKELKALNHKIAQIYEAETDLTYKEVVELMAIDVSSTPDFLIEKGFASEIIKYEAVASFRQRSKTKNKHKIKNNNKMTKDDKKWFKKMLNQIGKHFEPIKTKIVQDANGVELDFFNVSENDEVKVGDEAKIKETNENVNGEYLMPDGSIYIFEDGVLKEIKEGEDDSDAKIQELENKIAELEKEKNSYKEKISALKKDFKELKSKIKTEFKIETKKNKKSKTETRRLKKINI